MEYVQTVLVQIAATKLDDASGPQGLLSELERHRDLASAQRGFLGMRITRTANPEGNVLVVAETRWANNNAMADYSARNDNVAAIIEKHPDEIVAGSMQVHRMEALQSETAEAPNRVYDRLALALFVPLGILAFALVTVFFLSRIYLSLPAAGASIMAILVAVGIMAVCWYFATNPSVPRWQIAGIMALTTAALVGGGIAAAFYDEEHKEVLPSGGHEAVGNGENGGTEPTPSGPPGAPEIPMEDNEFPNGDLTIAGGADVVINVINNGEAIHNVHVAIDGYDGNAGAICRLTGEEPCTDPASIRAGQSGTLTVNLPAGSYDFRCDFHPDEMQATLVVE